MYPVERVKDVYAAVFNKRTGEFYHIIEVRYDSQVFDAVHGRIICTNSQLEINLPRFYYFRHSMYDFRYFKKEDIEKVLGEYFVDLL